MHKNIFHPLHNGHFAGFASTFNIDTQGDKVMPGAFNASIQSWQQRGKMPPLCLNHNKSYHVGELYLMEEKEDGLYIEGRIDADDLKTKLHKMPIGLSVSMLIENQKKCENIREICKAHIIEVSFADKPINQQAKTLINKQKTYQYYS